MILVSSYLENVDTASKGSQSHKWKEQDAENKNKNKKSIDFTQNHHTFSIKHSWQCLSLKVGGLPEHCSYKLNIISVFCCLFQ